jgi:hypothetical protein
MMVSVARIHLVASMVSIDKVHKVDLADGIIKIHSMETVAGMETVVPVISMETAVWVDQVSRLDKLASENRSHVLKPSNFNRVNIIS